MCGQFPFPQLHPQTISINLKQYYAQFGCLSEFKGVIKKFTEIAENQRPWVLFSFNNTKR